jgi:polyisoprenoid-binding protein YceI
MTKNRVLIIGAVILIAALGVIAYILRPPVEASGEVTAIPLEPKMEETEALLTEPTEKPMDEMVSSSSVVYVILQEESEVRFTLDEVLAGVPTTVIGVTNQVAGEIEINLENGTESRIGVITINARTLETDNSSRNRAINNSILQTNTYEFITFAPTSITGLPTAIVIGETYTIQITGDLTIRDVTQTVTFEVTGVVVSEDRVEGYAFTTILRSDFDLNIPSVPQVADVSDEVLLEIEFVAVKK